MVIGKAMILEMKVTIVLFLDIPVIASLEKDILILEFMEVGSDITVTIVGKNQILLSHSLLIDIPGKYCIPIDAYTPGVYLLELSNS